MSVTSQLLALEYVNVAVSAVGVSEPLLMATVAEPVMPSPVVEASQLAVSSVRLTPGESWSVLLIEPVIVDVVPAIVPVVLVTVPATLMVVPLMDSRLSALIDAENVPKRPWR